VTQAKRAIDEAQAKHAAAKQAFAEANAPIKQKKLEKTAYEKEMAKDNAAIKEQRAQIDVLRKELAKKASSDAQAKALREIEQTSSKLTALTDAKKSDALEDLMARQAVLHEEIEQCKAVLAPLDVKLKSREIDLRELQRLKSAPVQKGGQHVQQQHLAKFGAWVPGFVQALELQKHAFSKPPIFTGAKVSVLPGQEKWATALQASLGRNMAGFVVNSQADATALYKLANDKGVPKVRTAAGIMASKRLTATAHRATST